MSAAGRVLVADDDRLSRAVFADALRAVGHEVEVAADGQEALDKLAASTFDLLLTDLLMPGIDGLELLERAKQRYPALEVIVLTSVSTAEPAVRALRSGAFHYLVKPVDPEALQLEVHRCLENRRIVAENAELRRYHALLAAAQRIATCIEAERLHPLALDAITDLVHADVGLLIRPAETEGLEVLARRGLESDQADWLSDLLWERHAPALGEAVEPLAVDNLGRLIPARDAALRHVEHALLVPLRRENRPLGVVALLRRETTGPFSAQDARDAAFLGESVALALENAERYVRAQLLAHMDSLTGLHNAAHLEHVVEREIRSRSESQTPFSLLFMDLDHFKRVNDTHGHQVGSRVLVEMSRLLRRCTREGDVLVRYGGDEFVVILPDADTPTALRAAERIRLAVQGHRFLSREGLNLQLTLCCGVCTWPRHATTRDDVVHRADLAMYHGKKTHRNAVFVYDALPERPSASTPLPEELGSGES